MAFELPWLIGYIDYGHMTLRSNKNTESKYLVKSKLILIVFFFKLFRSLLLQTNAIKKVHGRKFSYLNRLPERGQKLFCLCAECHTGVADVDYFPLLS